MQHSVVGPDVHHGVAALLRLEVVLVALPQARLPGRRLTGRVTPVAIPVVIARGADREVGVDDVAKHRAALTESRDTLAAEVIDHVGDIPGLEPRQVVHPQPQ